MGRLHFIHLKLQAIIRKKLSYSHKIPQGDKPTYLLVKHVQDLK